MTTAAMLSARGLSRTYRGTGTEVGVLKDVSIEVSEGQVVCIVGASGAGKSTLLHILGSLDRPDTGTVAIRGQDVHALSGKHLDRLRSETLGFVFQFHFLLPDFTALENVMMPALVARRSSMVLASHTVQVMTEATASPTSTACTTMSAFSNMPRRLRSRGSKTLPIGPSASCPSWANATMGTQSAIAAAQKIARQAATTD